MINKKTIRFIKEKKLTIVLYLIIIAITIPFETIGYSHFISDITTSVKGRNFNYTTIYRSIVFIIGIYILTRILYAIKYFFEVLISSHLIYYVRTNIFNEIIKKCQSNFDQIEKGKIISYLTSLPHIYEDKLHFLLAKILPDSIGVISLTSFFFFVDIKLGLLLFVMIICLCFTISRVSKKCIQLQQEKQDLYYSNNENIQDKLSNIFSILTSNKSSNEFEKNEQKEKEYRNKKFKSDFQDLKAENSLVVIILIFTVITLIYFIHLFKVKNNKKLIITAFLVFFSYLGYIDSIKWYVIDYLNKMSLIDQYEKTLENKTKIINGKKINFILNGDIKFNNISFSYGKKQVLKDLNLTFKNNNLNVIMGPSGTGKSTIFKLILKLAQPTSGCISIDGTDITYSQLDYLRNNIGIVNQNTTLFNTSLYENISYGNNSTKEKVQKLINEWNLNNTIFRNINMKNNVGVDGYYLSNGQRQMILILREYLNNKKIILMDEPTSSLDLESKKLILNILKKISKKKNIIITTHDEFVKQFSNNIVMIK